MDNKGKRKSKERKGTEEVPQEENVCVEEVLRVIGADILLGEKEVSEIAVTESVDKLDQGKEEKSSTQSEMKEKDTEYNEEILSEENEENKMSTENEEEEDEIVPPKNKRKFKKEELSTQRKGIYWSLI